MKTFFLPLLLLLLLALRPAHALTQQELGSLREAVREMCVLPDRAGDYLKVEGEAKAGLPVPVRIVKADLGGKISYDAWQGIPITLDKYKTDPRACAIELTKLLLPAFEASRAAAAPSGGKKPPAGSNPDSDTIFGLRFSDYGCTIASTTSITCSFDVTNLNATTEFGLQFGHCCSVYDQRGNSARITYASIANMSGAFTQYTGYTKALLPQNVKLRVVLKFQDLPSGVTDVSMMNLNVKLGGSLRNLSFKDFPITQL